MTHKLEIRDEQYEIITKAASRSGRTADQLLTDWIEGLRDPRVHPRYFETDEWFRHLGASNEMIERIKQEVRLEAESDANS